MKAVLDTSPLQALWRGGVLESLSALFDEILVPRSVADETRWSRALVGAKLVPDLEAHPHIKTRVVTDAELRGAMVPIFQAHHARISRRPRDSVEPQVAVVGGRALAWVTPKRKLAVTIPDLEVVVLSMELGAVAVVDDHRAIRIASDLGVDSVTTREVVTQLSAIEVVKDAAAIMKRILDTGYNATKRVKIR